MNYCAIICFSLDFQVCAESLFFSLLSYVLCDDMLTLKKSFFFFYKCLIKYSCLYVHSTNINFFFPLFFPLQDFLFFQRFVFGKLMLVFDDGRLLFKSTFIYFLFFGFLSYIILSSSRSLFKYAVV